MAGSTCNVFFVFLDSRLVNRFLSGQKPFYKPVDYEQVAAYSKIRNASAKNSLRKIEKLQEVNKQNKNVQMLQEHRRIWENEIRRLKVAEDKIENEIFALQPTNQNFELPTTAAEELYEDIFDLQDSQRLEMKAFVKSTIHPIHELRDDLQEWIQQNQSKLAVGYHEQDSEKDIMEMISSVKRQQASVMLQLEKEQKKLENALQELLQPEIGEQPGDSTHRSNSTTSSFRDNSSYTSCTSARLPNIVVGVPHKVLQQDCPDEGLKESCFEEFESVDEKYVNAIECLEDKYKDVIERYVKYGILLRPDFQYKKSLHICEQLITSFHTHKSSYSVSLQKFHLK